MGFVYAGILKSCKMCKTYIHVLPFILIVCNSHVHLYNKLLQKSYLFKILEHLQFTGPWK